jgi:hypothetical protein
VTSAEELAVPAVTLNVAEVEPCGITTLAGTLASMVLELESATVTPPVPAAAVRVTVPVPDCPLTRTAGFTAMPLRAPDAAGGGLIVTPKIVLTPALDAVKVTAFEEVTVPAVTVNVAEVEPAGTVTLAGTPAAVALELESVTTMPPVPAAVVRLTVPVPVWPLTIVLGLTDTLLSAAAGGVMVTPKVLFTPE